MRVGLHAQIEYEIFDIAIVIAIVITIVITIVIAIVIALSLIVKAFHVMTI